MIDGFSKVEIYKATLRDLVERMEFLKEVLPRDYSKDEDPIIVRAWYLVSIESQIKQILDKDCCV